MTISPVIRIVALVAAVIALGAGAFVLIETMHHNKPAAATSQTQTSVVKTHTTVASHHAAATHHATAVRSATASQAAAEAFPPRLTHLLRYHSIVVVAIFAPGVLGEAGLVKAAKLGAKQAHAGFVTLDIRNEKTAEMVALRYPGAFDPAVLILDRQGNRIMMLNGVQQSTAVAQAVTDARG